MGEKCRYAKEASSLLNQITDVLTLFINNLYVSTGLLGIVLAMTIESCCIPLPSEIVMPVAGIMIASKQPLPGTIPGNVLLDLIFVALAGAIGCLVGSMIAYGIGAKGGRPLMLKYGRYLLISQHDADLADKFFQRWGSPTAFFSRLLPVVRTYISLPAGISKMPFVKFCIYTFLGSFPFCLLLAYVGTIIGDHRETLSPIFHALDGVIAVVLVILLVLYIRRHIRNDRKARAALASAAQDAQQPATMPFNQTMQNQQQWGQPQQPPFAQPWATQQAPYSSQPQQPGWGQPQQSNGHQPQQPYPQQAPSQPVWNQPQPSQFQPPFPQQAPSQPNRGQQQYPQQR